MYSRHISDEHYLTIKKKGTSFVPSDLSHQKNVCAVCVFHVVSVFISHSWRQRRGDFMGVEMAYRWEVCAICCRSRQGQPGVTPSPRQQHASLPLSRHTLRKKYLFSLLCATGDDPNTRTVGITAMFSSRVVLCVPAGSAEVFRVRCHDLVSKKKLTTSLCVNLK